MAIIPKKASERFVKTVGTFQKVLANAKDRDVNEADTVSIVADIVSSVFGFDKYTEITSEFCIRGTYCDLAIKVNNKPQYLIEVKAIGLDLKDNHLRQAVNYGATQGIQWVVLTNGIIWDIYNIRLEKSVQHELVCSIDLLTVNPRKIEDQEKLWLLCKEGLSKAAMDEFAHRAQSVNRFVIGAILVGDEVAKTIRKELKKIVPTLKIENSEIQTILKNEVLKREVFEGDSATRASGIIKKAYRQQKKSKTAQPIEQASKESNNE